MKHKGKRASTWFDRKASGATLIAPERETLVMVKLLRDGTLAIEIFRGGKRFHRELTPRVNYEARVITVEFDYSGDHDHFSEDVRIESTADLQKIREILAQAERDGYIEPNWYCDARQNDSTLSGKFISTLKAAVSQE